MVITNSSTLNSRYAIQSVLGEVGPFDVSYLAWDIQDEQEVVLREYYPLQFSKRALNGLTLEVNDPKHFEYGLGAYTAESHRLIDIQHPNVTSYLTNFKENGTIYSVSSYTAGASAYGYMTQQGGALSQEEALSFMYSILDGLKHCHEKKVFHGGIWPKSIHLTPDNVPILLGFSQARFQLAKQCEKFDQVHLPGFTAPEQAYKEVEPGPWWDIFGCAATLFYMLSGYQLNYQREQCTEEDIQSALHRETTISADLRPVLEKALSFDYKNRFESLEGFRLALNEATTQPTLLSMHTNGHHSNGNGYATSVSALPGTTTNHTKLPEDIIDVKELRALPTYTQPNGKTSQEPTEEPVSPPAVQQKVTIEDEAPAQPDPLEVKSSMEKEDQSPGSFVDLPTNGKSNTSMIPPPPQQAPVLLEQPKLNTPKPDAPPEQSDQEVAQLLSKMVKWQQKLIVFILGFVFMVLFGVLAIFAGPQVKNLLLGNSSEDETALQTSTMANAAAAPLAVDDSTGATIRQADIDSLYASIRAQLEAELTGSLAQQRIAEPNVIPTPRQQESDSPRRQQEENTSSSSSSSNNSQASSERTSSETQASGESESQEQEGNESIAATISEADSEEEGNDQGDAAVVDSLLGESQEALPLPEESDEERVNEMLKQREFQMYRTMGDSLMAQGFDELALQWYQSAIQQNPSDTYVTEQIRRIEEAKAVETSLEAAADSLAIATQNATDENGIFFAPDVPAQMIDEARVHRSVRYPPVCLSQTNGGRVIARAIVDETGTATSLMIAKSLHEACDKEVMRVLGEAEFEPAIFNGQPVASWYAFSVVFREE